MKFTEISSRITGISCPVFGVSWKPPKPDRDIAREILRFLEDRRVLYNPCEMEVPDHCVRSVLEIRKYLTNVLQKIPEKSKLFESLKAMRIACRKFLDSIDVNDQSFLRNAGSWGHYASWEFASALGVMRGTFGIMIAQIATSYGIDIEDDLASIIPGRDE